MYKNLMKLYQKTKAWQKNKNVCTFPWNINQTTPLAEIYTWVILLQQLWFNLRLVCNWLQSILRSKRVCDEQSILLGNITVPTGTVNGDIKCSTIRNPSWWITVEALQPLPSGQVGIVLIGNGQIGVSWSEWVLECVAKKLIIDAITREWNVDSGKGLDWVFVGYVVVADNIFRFWENRRFHDVWNVCEVRTVPEIVGS